jgi:phage-related protein
MAYNNPYLYDRDSSIDPKYAYVNDLSIYKPIYGSSVNFKSKYNFIETVDNALKVLPASENNLISNYSLRFLLSETEAGNLLKTIETAGGFKPLKFSDSSGLYKEFIGYVEDYSISRSSNQLNEITLEISCPFKAPILTWKTSSFFNISDLNFSESKSYKKNQFVYNEQYSVTSNKIDNFWFAKQDITAGAFNRSNWTKNFNFFPKLPFQLKNELDFRKFDYKNSFVQNLKYKSNSNILKEYRIKFESIDDDECLSILFFLEKKCGYRRFIYDFPVFFNQKKVFICTEWSHVFKYKNCHDIDVLFSEDPNPNILIDNNQYYYVI